MARARDYLHYLRPEYLTPDFEVKNISNINSGFLERKNIKGLIFDADNTLSVYQGESVDKIIEENFSELTKRFKSCILSNTSSKRRKKLEFFFGLPTIQSDIKKPFPEPFCEALEYLGTSAEETAMIGDRLLTDIAGANKMGMLTIKVKPLSILLEPPHHVFIRCLETFLLKLYQEEGMSEKTYLISTD